MNIFSRFLAQWSDDTTLHTFITHWDVIEAVAIDTYRQKKVNPADRDRYHVSRKWLLDQYPKFAEDLAPFWQKAQVAGSLEHGDPFLFLLESGDPTEFLDNWAALQHLPAAREALNQFIRTQGNG